MMLSCQRCIFAPNRRSAPNSISSQTYSLAVEYVSELDQLPDVLDGEREAEGEQHDKEGRKLDVPVARLVHQPDDGKGEQRKDDAARRMQDLIV